MTPRDRILARRMKLIAAALIAVPACSSPTNPKPCLSPACDACNQPTDSGIDGGTDAATDAPVDAPSDAAKDGD